MALEDDRRLKLAALYDRYGNLVYRRARKLLRNDALARDVCHEVFLALMGRADSLYEVNSESTQGQSFVVPRSPR